VALRTNLEAGLLEAVDMSRRRTWGRRPLYIALRLLRRSLPERVAHRVLSRRYVTPELVYAITKRYLKGIESAGLTGDFASHLQATALEAGTGVYNPGAAPFLLSGVSRLILLEPFVGAAFDADLFRRRFDSILRIAQADPTYPLPKNVRKSVGKPSTSVWPQGIELSDRLWEDTGLPPGSVDCIFSCSVLEHLRDPDAALDECARILRPGGWMINVIDMRDHFFRYPVEMLKYSERTWAWLTTRTGGSGYLNRWRLTHWLAALERRGLSTHVVPEIVLDDEVKTELPCFDPEFRDLPFEHLRVLKAILVSRCMSAGAVQHPQERPAQ